MSLNDGQHGEFDSELQDEYTFDAHYPPGVEIGAGVDDFGENDEDYVSAEEQAPLDLQHDQGSGSYAEDGRLEVAEDRTMSNGESQVGSAAMYGPTEIGEDDFEGVDRNYLTDVGAADREYASEIGSTESADRGGSEIGEDFEQEEVYLRNQYEIGSTESADRGGSEIGDARNAGYIAAYGQSEIGADGRALADHPSHPYYNGHAAASGQSEIGAADREYASEIGLDSDVMMPFESFMLDETRMGEKFSNEFGVDDVGAAPAAVVKVIEKARDNRQPPPPMKAVDVEAPSFDDDDFGLTDVCVGVAEVTGNPNPFPLTSQLMLRAGATIGPRIVRVDTEQSYKAFLVQQSPELADLKARFEAHVSDPNAHGGPSSDLDDLEGRSDLSDDIDDLVHLGAEAEAIEAQKRVELWMPKRFDGLVTAWREGDFVCASLTLPGKDGEVRICTSLEPISKCVEEMSRHAAEANVPAAAVVGSIPAMGCVLGAGTVLKEMAAAAPAILSRPEASLPAPFVVRIEPKVNPALGALMMLVAACRQGNQQACAEWQKLGELSAGPVKQAMGEALQLAKAAGA